MRKLPVFALFVALLPAAAGAAVVEKEVPFALDEWITLEVTDGPVTLHRVKLTSDSGPMSKPGMTRPGESHSFLKPVQVVLEYTNAGKEDWEAQLRLVWVDAAGVEMDGFLTKENLDHEEAKETAKSSLATLRYALDHAETLRLRIEFRPE
jgi:hypothetical protein